MSRSTRSFTSLNTSLRFLLRNTPANTSRTHRHDSEHIAEVPGIFLCRSAIKGTVHCNETLLIKGDEPVVSSVSHCVALFFWQDALVSGEGMWA